MTLGILRMYVQYIQMLFKTKSSKSLCQINASAFSYLEKDKDTNLLKFEVVKLTRELDSIGFLQFVLKT